MISNWILTPGYRTFFTAGELLSGVRRASPLFLISAGADNRLNQIYYEAAHEPKILWARPEDGHMDGLFAHPQEYEEKVIAFLDHTLMGK